MPADHPDRAFFVQTFKTMAAKLISIQRADGYWPTSLKDPAIFTNPETSGSAFFTFGLAWGLNQGVLQGDEYVAARDRGWAALVRAVGDDGHFGWVQQIGKDPQATTADSTQLYGTGGFLLAASEMIRASRD
jgi:unsaturated rhamnogalacturonyl hydrolase